MADSCFPNRCMHLCLPNLCQKEELLETFDSPQGGGIEEHVQSDLPEKFQVSIWMVLPGISIQVEHFSRFHGLTKLLLETYLCSVQALPTLQSHISLTWIIEKILYAKYFDEKRCSICIPAPTLRKYWRQNILTNEILSVPTGSNTEKAGNA